MVGMATLPQTLLETVIISVGRGILFFACRHYLLKALYYDLRHLTSPTTSTSLPPTPSHEGVPRNSDTELDELPPPATSPRMPSDFTGRSQPPGTWHSMLSHGTFSLCFSESCTLFMLVLSQAMNFFSHRLKANSKINYIYWLTDRRARYLNWRLSLGLLLSTILLAAPLQQCLLLTYRTSSRALDNRRRSIIRHLVLTGIPYSLYLIIFSHIPVPSRLESPELTAATLSRLVVLGTIILGILAGFGAASAVFTYFHLAVVNREPVSDAQVVASEQALFRVRSDLLERRRQLERNAESEPESRSGLFSRLNPFSGNTELSSIRREIQGLEALEYQMSRNAEFMHHRRRASHYAMTLRGRVWSCIGALFALYCAFRVVNSIINLVYPLSSKGAVSTPDFLASLVARFVSLFFPISKVDIAAASRQFSLLLVGAIILSSVRRALKGVTRILKVTSKNLAASILLLILAQLMGTYLLSTLIQLRTSFPSPSADEENTNLFRTLPEYHVFGPLWDGAFLASVTISGAVRWFDDRVNGPGLD